MTSNYEFEDDLPQLEIVTRSQCAESSGLLPPIAAGQAVAHDRGIDFQILHVRNETKELTCQSPENSFIDYEPELFLGDLTNHHVALLNKNRVMNHDFLIVTREFEHQESLLKLRDFQAISICLHQFDALVVYNGGNLAGACAPHKHIHVVTRPFNRSKTVVPIEAAFGSVQGDGPHIRNAPNLPFQHAFSWLNPDHCSERLAHPITTYDIYVDLMESLGIRSARTEGMFWQPIAYNLLLTRRWILLIPRTARCAQDICIDGLSFAGFLMVQNKKEHKQAASTGPMEMLRTVGAKRL